jgi:hypothetical protein
MRAMADDWSKLLKELKNADFRQWVTTLWLAKRRLFAGDATYVLLRVDTEKKLQTKLRRMLTDRIQGKNYKIEPYSFLTADQDQQIFTIDAADTDFKKIEGEISNGLDNAKAENYEDLLNSWAYVIQVKHKAASLYGFRKISSLTQAKKVNSFASFIFQNHLLVDLADKQVFTIDKRVDFFVYGATAFITDKKGFEIALNFRQGMEKNRDTVLQDFVSLGIVKDVGLIRKTVGSNLHLLRKISVIQRSGYYRDKGFMAKLMTVSSEEKWPLTFENDAIVVSEDNVDLVLTLLTNSRLKSPINQEVFDATVKKKVG